MHNTPDTNAMADMGDDAFAALLESGTVPEVTPLGVADTATDPDTQTESDELPEVDQEEEEGTTDEDAEVEEEAETDPESTQSDELAEEPDTADADESGKAEPELDPRLVDLFSPFKADGSEMSVTSVAEARQLMQQGVAFNNRMAGFKPHRKTIKTLANNNIDEAKLNYLIDLSNGNKDAIAKLVKDNDIDVHSFDQEDSSYSPSDHSVSDVEVDLDDVITRMQATESFSTTSDIVSNQWDTASKQALFADPAALENLNAQVANGTYARVKQEVTRRKAFGGLQGLNNLQAYSQVGNEMEAAGQFNAQAQPAKVVTTAPKAVSKTNTDQKRRASPAKRKAVTTPAKVNYAEMSDDDFEKLLK